MGLEHVDPWFTAIHHFKCVTVLPATSNCDTTFRTLAGIFLNDMMGGSVDHGQQEYDDCTNLCLTDVFCLGYNYRSTDQR